METFKFVRLLNEALLLCCIPVYSKLLGTSLSSNSPGSLLPAKAGSKHLTGAELH